MSQPAAPIPVDDLPDTLMVEFQRGSLFRVIHVDGGYGGVSPQGDYIVLSLYNERRPLPLHETMTKTEGTTYSKTGSEGPDVLIVREVEASLMMNLRAAEDVHAWLGRNIAAMKELQKRL